MGVNKTYSELVKKSKRYYKKQGHQFQRTQAVDDYLEE